jgi:glycosyltransferase involved in cell wall biosynthesis
MEISVVICTYNRSQNLRETLASVAKMEVPASLSWELIVVDNNSTDSTRAVVEGFARTSGLNVRYVFEGKQGLSHARNAGVRAAHGKIIAFTDDDVYPQPDWLAVIWREFSLDLSLQVLSGRVELFNPGDLAITVRREKERVAFRTVSDSFNLMVGCNCAVRHELIDRIGNFDVNFGAGAHFESAEDSDFFFRAWRSGGELIYEPSLFVFHDHGRSTPEAGRNIQRSYAVGRGAFYAKQLLKGDFLIVRPLVQELKWSLIALLKREEDKGWKLLWLFKGFSGYCRMRAGGRLLPTFESKKSSTSARIS